VTPHQHSQVSFFRGTSCCVYQRTVQRLYLSRGNGSEAPDSSEVNQDNDEVKMDSTDASSSTASASFLRCHQRDNLVTLVDIQFSNCRSSSYGVIDNPGTNWHGSSGGHKTTGQGAYHNY